MWDGKGVQVVEYLPSKCEDLSSNHNITKKKMLLMGFRGRRCFWAEESGTILE
jgi:hypothetical protein